jgi:hypothetical protein
VWDLHLLERQQDKLAEEIKKQEVDERSPNLPQETTAGLY